MAELNGEKYRELRCQNTSCRKLFILEKILVGRIAWKCGKCSHLNEWTFTMLKTKENKARMESLLIHNSKGDE